MITSATAIPPTLLPTTRNREKATNCSVSDRGAKLQNDWNEVLSVIALLVTRDSVLMQLMNRFFQFTVVFCGISLGLAFTAAPLPLSHSAGRCFVLPATTAEDVEGAIQSDLAVLYRAVETKQEDSETVYMALADLEKRMRQAAKEDDNIAKDMLKNLNGDWRLVFTTGTKNTQEKYGKINYFPLKAVQSFRTQTDPMLIENGIYIGDFALVKFAGTMEFDLKKRRLEFDFGKVGLFNGLFDITLKQGEAAQLGAKSGLGSESNTVNAERGKKAFFNWISADEKVATARGGGGGLALWKRVEQPAE